MHETNSTPALATPAVPTSAPPVRGVPLDFRWLSVRELISALAETEAVLRDSSDGSIRYSTVQRQALIVGELRRRQGRPRRPQSVPRPALRIAGGTPSSRS